MIAMPISITVPVSQHGYAVTEMVHGELTMWVRCHVFPPEHKSNQYYFFKLLPIIDISEAS